MAMESALLGSSLNLGGVISISGFLYDFQLSESLWNSIPSQRLSILVTHGEMDEEFILSDAKDQVN